jgi:hypothetical protein
MQVESQQWLHLVTQVNASWPRRAGGQLLIRAHMGKALCTSR